MRVAKALVARLPLILPSVRLAIALPLSYFAAAVFAIYLSGQAGNIASLWLANAIVVAALLRNRAETWPVLLLLGGAADFAANIVMGSNAAAASGVAVADQFQALAVAVAVDWLGGSKSWFTSSRWMAVFAASCVAAPAATALAGTAWLFLLGEAPFGVTWKLWFVADTLGLVIVTPLLLVWTEDSLRSNNSRARLLEVALQTCVVGAVAIFVFAQGTMPLLFLVFPFLLLITFRGGLLGATAGIVALAIIAMWFTLNGNGPIALLPNHLGMVERVQMMQVYLLIAVVSTLPVAVVLTQRAMLTRQLGHLAKHDLLTELPNRPYFEEKLSEALRQATRGRGFAVLSLDLDRFKEVNDTFGHACGDAVLQQVAKRLRGTVRAGSTVARFGGDELMILQTDVERPEDATALAERIVKALAGPHELYGKECFLGASIGIALAPADGRDPEDLLRKADLALYHAKKEGCTKYRFFDADMDARQQARHTAEAGLRSALDNGDLILEYQPILDLKTGAVTGFEALIRWRHATRGVILPDEFVAIAEDIGLIVPTGEWALKRACADAARWPGAINVAVNLSATQIKHPGIITSVTDALESSGLPAERLELEVTEPVLLEDTEATVSTLHRLRATGVRIVMDDFGIGYSSLNYLRAFPFDKIKIDHRFVREVPDNDGSAAIVQATIQLAHRLGIATIAEGIETAEQLAFLRAKGCIEGQGFYLSPPLPVEQVSSSLAWCSGRPVLLPNRETRLKVASG